MILDTGVRLDSKGLPTIGFDNSELMGMLDPNSQILTLGYVAIVFFFSLLVTANIAIMVSRWFGWNRTENFIIYGLAPLARLFRVGSFRNYDRPRNSA